MSALAATAPTVAVDVITDADRMDYVAAAHLGGSYAGIASINPIIHLDDYRLGGARYAIDCMIERKTGRVQGGHVDASASGVSPVPKGESGGLLGGPKTAGVAIPDGANGRVSGGDVDRNQVFVSMDDQPSLELWTIGTRVYLAAAPSPADQQGE